MSGEYDARFDAWCLEVAKLANQDFDAGHEDTSALKGMRVYFDRGLAPQEAVEAMFQEASDLVAEMDDEFGDTGGEESSPVQGPK